MIVDIEFRAEPDTKVLQFRVQRLVLVDWGDRLYVGQVPEKTFEWSEWEDMV